MLLLLFLDSMVAMQVPEDMLLTQAALSMLQSVKLILIQDTFMVVMELSGSVVLLVLLAMLLPLFLVF